MPFLMEKQQKSNMHETTFIVRGIGCRIAFASIERESYPAPLGRREKEQSKRENVENMKDHSPGVDDCPFGQA